MNTCQELDGLLERLCDLTRQMPSIDRIREATDLLVDAEKMPRNFVMEYRAAAAADLHYLDGMPIRQIANQVGMRVFQAISQWLRAHGPSHYLMLRKTGNRPVELKLLEVAVGQATTVTQAKVRHYRSGGYRIAPATLNLLDGADIRPGLDPEKLWADLGPTEPAG